MRQGKGSFSCLRRTDRAQPYRMGDDIIQDLEVTQKMYATAKQGPHTTICHPPATCRGRREWKTKTHERGTQPNRRSSCRWAIACAQTAEQKYTFARRRFSKSRAVSRIRKRGSQVGGWTPPRRTDMDGADRLCRGRDIPPLDGRAMLRLMSGTRVMVHPVSYQRRTFLPAQCHA